MLMPRIRLIFTTISMLFLLLSGPVQAGTLESIYVCVEPLNSSDNASLTEPYLIEFAGSNAFGFVIPHEARITLYASSKDVQIARYEVAPDADTGGYRRIDQRQNLLRTGTALTDRSPCRSTYSDFLTDDLLASDQITVSPSVNENRNQAILVEIDSVETAEVNYLDEADFLGVFSIQIRPEEPGRGNFPQDFQVIQFLAGEIDVRFPFLSKHLTQESVTRVIVIGSKDVTLTRKFPDQPSFATSCSADERSNFATVLSSQLINRRGGDEKLNLYTLMEEANLPIYPAFGHVYEYPIGGWIALSVSDSRNERETTFIGGDLIQALDGVEVDYVLKERPGDVAGRMKPDTNETDPTRLTVEEVDDQGQLIARDNTDLLVIVPAWLVEVVPN